MIKKAIILAGGAGSRLYPLTKVASKQLQPVYDKPMIYYPLTVLIAAGINDFCLISTPADLPKYESLFGNGKDLGLCFSYIEQPKPEGIAQAFILARDWIGDSNIALILGDNIFSGSDDIPNAIAQFVDGAMIFAYRVPDPQRYGVVEFDGNMRVLSLEEKPLKPKSNYAVPGIYLYDNQVIDICKSLSPSARAELEITDVNLEYLRQGKLKVQRLSRGFAWLDAGTSGALHEASEYIAAIEKRQGIKIGCPEEAAFVRKFISYDGMRCIIDKMPKCEYRLYLERLIDDK